MYIVKAITEKLGKVDSKAFAAALHGAKISVKDYPACCSTSRSTHNGDLDRESFLVKVDNGKQRGRDDAGGFREIRENLCINRSTRVLRNVVDPSLKLVKVVDDAIFRGEDRLPRSCARPRKRPVRSGHALPARGAGDGHRGATAAGHGRLRHALRARRRTGLRYGLDNRCLIDAIAHSAGRYKGHRGRRQRCNSPISKRSRTREWWGWPGTSPITASITMQARRRCSTGSAHSTLPAGPGGARPARAVAPDAERSGVRILIDHCGRPTPAAGLDQPGFRALLGLAATRRAFVSFPVRSSFRASRFRTTTRAPTSTRCSTRSRRMAACGRRIGRSQPRRVDYGVLLSRCCRS